MRLKSLSVKNLCLLTGGGTLVTMLFCAMAWQFLLVLFFGRRLSVFTSDLCRTLDHMINGDEKPEQTSDYAVRLAIAKMTASILPIRKMASVIFRNPAMIKSVDV